MNRLTLFVLVAAMPAAPAVAAAPANVAITLSSYQFSPKVIRLAAGAPVRLTFTNVGGKGHDFTAPGFFARSTIRSGSARGGEIDLPAHATAAMTLVPARGTFRFWCGHFGHKQLGMSGTIIVD